MKVLYHFKSSLSFKKTLGFSFSKKKMAEPTFYDTDDAYTAFIELIQTCHNSIRKSLELALSNIK